MDSRGFPTSLPEFQRVFPNDPACARYLEKMRWPGGFTCSKCGRGGEPYRFPSRSSVVLRCRDCKKNTSLTSGTVMQSTHTPLSTWFWGAYLVTTQTPGQSALQFQRQLGLSRYETAFQILHKLRAGMVRPEREGIGGPYTVEVDECFVGGRAKTHALSQQNKAVVVGAVELRVRADAEERFVKHRQKHGRGAPQKKLVYAGRLRLRVAPDRGLGLLGFIKENIIAGSRVRTAALPSYKSLPTLGYEHQRLTLEGDPEKAEAHLPMIHLVFSNLKTWILGTHHGAIRHQHLQAYLNEYVYRFNRRFHPMTAFNSVLGLAAHSTSPTYEELYSGVWVHPAGAARSAGSLPSESHRPGQTCGASEEAVLPVAAPQSFLDSSTPKIP